MVLQGSFSSWRKRASAAERGRGGLDRPCQDRLDSFKLTWRKRRKRENTSSSPFFFLLCLKTSGAVTSVLFPFLFTRRRKKKIPFYFFISLILRAPYSNWSWCALDGWGNWCGEVKVRRKRRSRPDFCGPRLIPPPLFFLFDTFDDIRIKRMNKEENEMCQCIKDVVCTVGGRAGQIGWQWSVSRNSSRSTSPL